jgi:hypothetical protein
LLSRDGIDSCHVATRPLHFGGALRPVIDSIGDSVHILFRAASS